MARYLIAGAAGYTGSRLAERLLAQGHAVRGLVRDPESDVVQRLAGRGMVVWEGDVTRPETLVGVASGIEYVYNLTSRSILSNGHLRRLCVDGNCNLIAACSRARTVRSYVFAGNTAPYGDRGDDWLTEDDATNPSYPFGAVMADAEQSVLDLVRVHNIPAILLRVGTIYGPGRDPIDAVRAGTTTLIGTGRNFLPHIQIDDLLAVLERVAVDGQPGGIYNVCDDDPLRALDLYAEISRRVGVPAPRPIPVERARFAGLDASVIGKASASTRTSNERAVRELQVLLRYPSVRDWLDERLPETVMEAELELAH